MTLMFSFYKAGTSCLSLAYPFVKLHSLLYGKPQKSMYQRFGLYPEIAKRHHHKSPRIWLHAASVGEVSVAHAIFKALEQLLPEFEGILSTTTKTGNDFANSVFPKKTPLIFAPIDIPKTVRDALSFIHPDVMVFVETELWPNWTISASQLGIPTILVNGRISKRSMKRYEKITPLTREVLSYFDCLSMIHLEDSQRIQQMGADKKIIKINGNAKFDNLVRQREASETELIRRRYSLSDRDVVFVAGSTRQNEGEQILRAYQEIVKKYPNLLLLIAPRHIERATDIARCAENMGLDCQFRSDFDGKKIKRTSPLVIIDVIGELSTVYGVSTFCFCGGSLAPLGGQNVLEPVSWGKPVFYGPHMEDFQEARDLIEAAVGDAFLVTDGNMLVKKAVAILEDPEYGQKIGEAARQRVLKNRGAARRHAKEIVTLLNKFGKRSQGTASALFPGI